MAGQALLPAAFNSFLTYPDRPATCSELEQVAAYQILGLVHFNY
jgi:hypothetical protein